MAISIQTSFAFELERPTDVLLQFEAALGPIVPLLDGSVGVKVFEVVPMHIIV